MWWWRRITSTGIMLQTGSYMRDTRKTEHEEQEEQETWELKERSNFILQKPFFPLSLSHTHFKFFWRYLCSDSSLWRSSHLLFFPFSIVSQPYFTDGRREASKGRRWSWEQILTRTRRTSESSKWINGSESDQSSLLHHHHPGVLLPLLDSLLIFFFLSSSFTTIWGREGAVLSLSLLFRFWDSCHANFITRSHLFWISGCVWYRLFCQVISICEHTS